MKKQLLKSSFYRYVEITVAMATSLILTPFLISQLGETNYGLWILILSTLGWFSFVDLGFSSAIQRQITFAIEYNDNHAVNSVFSCSIILFIILGGIATSGVFFLGVFPQILGIPEQYLTTTSTIFFILCLKIFMDFLMCSIHGIFVGHIRYDIDANIGTASTLLKAILVFLVVNDYGIYGVVFATMIADIINHVIKIYYVRKLQNTLVFSFSLVTFSEIKNLFSFSKHVIASTIARTIHNKSDPIIIANVIDISSITMFSIADRLANMVESLVIAIVGVFEPVFMRLEAKKHDIKSTFSLVFSINCFITGSFFIPLSILANDFIILWVGEQFSFSATLTFILIFAFLARTISRPISSVLLARAQHKIMSLVNLAGALINITLSIYLGYHYGLIGIVISTTISFLFADVVLYLLMLKHYTNISISEIRIKFFLLVLLYLLMSLFGHYLILEPEHLSWFILIINSLIVFLVNIILCWFILLNTDAKEKIGSLFFTVLQKIYNKKSK